MNQNPVSYKFSLIDLKYSARVSVQTAMDTQPRQIVSYTQQKSTFLFILDCNKNSLREVSQHDFNYATGGVIRYRHFLVKFIGATRKASMGLLPTLFSNLHFNFSNSHFSKRGVDSVNSRLSPQVLTELRDLRAYFNVLNDISVRLRAVAVFVKDNSRPLIESLLDSFLIFFEILEGTITWTKVIRVLLNVARIWYRMKPLVSSANAETQSAEALLMGAATLALPARVVEALRRVAMFSSVKFLDDASLIFDLLSSIGDFFTSLLFDFSSFSFYSIFTSFFGIFSHYSTLYKMREMLRNYEINKRCVLEERFRENVMQLDTEIQSNAVVLDWIKRSGKIDALVRKFTRLVKTVKSFDSTSRVEPFSLCFEGPPGCLKSVVMSSLIKVLNRTVYTHSIKAMMDGKDFYDSYNGEEIFCMDDVGQQGVSQYRTIINLVSPIKYPLECASVDLKDTKYFTSSCVMFTTNKFTTLGGVTKNDCISDIKALWRRVVVINMSDVKRVGNALLGSIGVRYFDTKLKAWVSGFPEDVVAFMMKRSINIPYTIDVTPDNPNCMLELYGWLSAVYRVIFDTKLQNESENTLSQVDLVRAQNISNNYYVQGASASTGKSNESTGDTSLPETTSSDPWEPWTDTRTDVVQEPPLISDRQTWKDAFSWISELLQETSTWFFNTVVSSLTAHMAMMSSPSWTTVAFSALAGLAAASVTIGVTEYINRKVDTRHRLAQQAVTDNVNFTNTMATFISTQMFTGKCVEDNSYTTILISGHYIIANYHWTPRDKFHCIVYRNFDKDHRLIDQLPVQRVFTSEEDDVAVFQMDDAVVLPFKSMSHFFGEKRERKGTWLVTSKGPLKLLGTVNADTIIYNYFGKDHIIDPGQGIAYEYGFRGLCGSLLFSEREGIIGSHVAGGEARGISRIWKQETVQKIKQILSVDKYLLDVEIHPREEENVSGAKLNVREYGSTPKKSRLVPSPLYGVFDVTREPANLMKYGEHTVKTIFAECRSPVSDVDTEELRFAKDVIKVSFDNFGVLTNTEVVKGTELLAGLAKDTSTGPYMLKDREEYVDFESGEFKPLLLEEIQKVSMAVDSGNVKLRDIIQQATLKDEIRDITKAGVPRCFMVLRMVMNVLLKKYTGRFVESIIKLRDFNHIMVGINPYNDFDIIYRTLGKNTICSDIKFYDKKMLPQVQFMVRDVMLERFTGTNKEKQELKFLLTLLICGATMVNDDVFLVTHSMPSGCYLTAIVNSLVNKAYGAMWFYRMTRGTVKDYTDSLIYRTYGDDLMITVKQHTDVLNALTLRDFFRSVGLDLTTSSKKEITDKFDDTPEFLKRTFRYHPDIGKVMCPLSLTTLRNTLSWIWDDKDLNQVLQDKLHMFQREAFLHADYENLVALVEKAAEERGISFTRLPKAYLIYLYSNRLVEYESVDGVLRT